jgi:hypothetical protein
VCAAQQGVSIRFVARRDDDDAVCAAVQTASAKLHRLESDLEAQRTACRSCPAELARRRDRGWHRMAFQPARAKPRQPTIGKPINEEVHAMLYTIAVVLLILWVFGLVSSYTMGGFIHILLVIAVVMILVNLISGRRSL